MDIERLKELKDYLRVANELSILNDDNLMQRIVDNNDVTDTIDIAIELLNAEIARQSVTDEALAEPSNSCDICGGCESMTYTVNCIRGSGIELRYKTHRGNEAHYCPNCGKALKGGEDG